MTARYPMAIWIMKKGNGFVGAVALAIVLASCRGGGTGPSGSGQVTGAGVTQSE